MGIRDKKRVELLAPAGSFESLKGAVHAGADAVYMGGALFSARAYADNPDSEGLKRSVEYCHFYGRNLYLAVNTLLKQDEIDAQLYDYMASACEAGIDGVIVQDRGVMQFINNRFKGLPIHISTQASVMTAGGAEYLRSRYPAVSRVVPARELSISELKRFRKETDLEIEVFVHGALCVCYSGMCLMSSYIGDRSGNRGRCAQPCRKEYGYLTDDNNTGHGKAPVTDQQGKYLLSPKDQCLLDDIPELIEIGIDSFKIEGRMKSPEYTAGTVAVYRRKIDEVCGTGSEIYLNTIVRTGERFFSDNISELSGERRVSDKIYEFPGEIRFSENNSEFPVKKGNERSIQKKFSREDNCNSNILAELYNRGGFNRGYLYQHNGRDMMSMVRPNHSGVRIGTVEKVNGREVVIRLSNDGYPHDVLEIRRGEKKIFEFTTAEGFKQGSTIKTLTMKDSRANTGDQVFRTRCNEVLEEIRKTFIDNDLKKPVGISFKAHLGENAVLTLSADIDPVLLTVQNGDTASDRISVSSEGIPAIEAQKTPLSEESIKKQLCKLGDTRFEAGEVRIDIDNNIFIPVSQLNEMRRDACGKLEKAIIEAMKPEWCGNLPGEKETSGAVNFLADETVIELGISLPDETAIESGMSPADETVIELEISPTDMMDFSDETGEKDDIKDGIRDDIKDNIFVSCRSIEQIIAVNDAGIKDICYNINSFSPEENRKAVEAAGGPGRIIIGLPYACRYEILDRLKEYIGKMISEYEGIRFMVRNFDELALLEGSFPEIIAGHRFETDYMPYCLNSGSFMKDACRVTLSTEADINELKSLVASIHAKNDHKNEIALIIYGYQPSMITAQCIRRNITGKCEKNSSSEGIISNGSISESNISNGSISEGIFPNGRISNGNTSIVSAGREFKTLRMCDLCTNIVYNSDCLNNIEHIGELRSIGIDSFRIDLTFEDAAETSLILESVINKRELPAFVTQNRVFTKGHLYRKVL